MPGEKVAYVAHTHFLPFEGNDPDGPEQLSVHDVHRTHDFYVLTPGEKFFLFVPGLNRLGTMTGTIYDLTRMMHSGDITWPFLQGR